MGVIIVFIIVSARRDVNARHLCAEDTDDHGVVLRKE